MLIIENVNPTGLFCFAKCETVDLTNRGLIHVVGINEDKYGDSNGSGKSSLFNSICEVLFRENPTKVSGDGCINSSWGRGFSARVTFISWERTTYRVTYCRKWGSPIYQADNDNRTEYTGTALYLDKLVNGTWVDCRGSSMRETEARVQDALGLTYDQFLAVSYLSPRVGSLLLRGANKDRMDILSGVVGLSVWDDILEKLRVQKKSISSEMQKAEAQKAYLNGELNQLVQQRDNAAIVDIDSNLSTLALKIPEVESKRLDLDLVQERLTAEMKALNASRDKLWAELNSSDIQDKIGDIQQKLQLVSTKKLNVNVPIDSQVIQACEAAKAALNLAKGRLSAIKSDNALATVEKCPTCGTKITKASRDKMEKAIANAQSVVDACQADVNRHQVLVTSAESTRLEAVAKQQSVLDKELIQLKNELEMANIERNTRMLKYNELGEAPNALQNKISQVTAEQSRLFNELSQLQYQVNYYNKLKSEYQTLLDRVKAKTEEVTLAETKWSELVSDVMHREWLITNIPFIKLHKLSLALTELSDLTNSYLDQMGDTARIIFSSFKEKRKASSDLKADALKSEISLVITDGAKNIDPRLYSDGETARFANAVTRGLHALASKHGQGCNLILLDEVFSYVDVGNSQKMAGSFADTLPGQTVLITDNSGMAKNLMQFAETWTIRKSNGLATIEA